AHGAPPFPAAATAKCRQAVPTDPFSPPGRAGVRSQGDVRLRQEDLPPHRSPRRIPPDRDFPARKRPYPAGGTPLSPFLLPEDVRKARREPNASAAQGAVAPPRTAHPAERPRRWRSPSVRERLRDALPRHA